MKLTADNIRNLVQEYGSPLYCFDEQGFVDNFNRFVQCFQRVYSNYKVSYSYKTNYTPAVCKLVKECGGHAEVVSDMEYCLARELGYANENIIYNGPCKGSLAIEHLENNGILNIDSIEELKAVCIYAKAHSERQYFIGLRLNLDVGQPFISRFGIDIDSADLSEACEWLDRCPNLTLIGLHCHISQARGLDSWKKRTERMLEISDKIIQGLPHYIDLGSGMYGEMTASLSAQFANIPSYEQYATVTAGLVNEHYKAVPDEQRPILFTEPGTTLINRYVSFIAQVTAIKQIRGKQFVVVDGSSQNIGEICKLKKLPVQVIHRSEDKTECVGADIVGYTCLEHDVMYQEYNGSLAVGDYLIFENVGGYSNVSKPPFIKPNCAMISIGEDGIKTIKHREKFEDIFRTYVM